MRYKIGYSLMYIANALDSIVPTGFLNFIICARLSMYRKAVYYRIFELLYVQSFIFLWIIDMEQTKAIVT